jgi:hypothetical protein
MVNRIAEVRAVFARAIVSQAQPQVLTRQPPIRSNSDVLTQSNGQDGAERWL